MYITSNQLQVFLTIHCGNLPKFKSCIYEDINDIMLNNLSTTLVIHRKIIITAKNPISLLDFSDITRTSDLAAVVRLGWPMELWIMTLNEKSKSSLRILFEFIKSIYAQIPWESYEYISLSPIYWYIAGQTGPQCLVWKPERNHWMQTSLERVGLHQWDLHGT